MVPEEHYGILLQSILLWYIYHDGVVLGYSRYYLESHVWPTPTLVSQADCAVWCIAPFGKAHRLQVFLSGTSFLLVRIHMLMSCIVLLGTQLDLDDDEIEDDTEEFVPEPAPVSSKKGKKRKAKDAGAGERKAKKPKKKKSKKGDSGAAGDGDVSFEVRY